MTPDEVLRLPYDEALLFIGGLPPYRARKLMYYIDERFAARVDPTKFPPPESRRRQTAELLDGRIASAWELLVPPVPAAVVFPAPAVAGPAPAAVEAAATDDESIPGTGNGGLLEGWKGYFGQTDTGTSPAPPEDAEEQPPSPRRPGSIPL